jgi:uncharacterized membrane protein YesL
MSWLTPLWLKDGPGIAKDAPPKQGLALFADVIGRNWWELVQLNLLVVLFSLPLVTIPAASVAATRICVLMLEDKPLYLGRDFVEAFRKQFWRATALGIVVAAAVVLSGYAAFIFLQAARGSVLFALPLTVSLCTGVFALVAAGYGFTLLVTFEGTLAEVMRRALLGALWRPWPVLATLGFVAALWVLHVIFYPASIFMPAAINFSFGTLAVTFGSHEATVRLLALEHIAAVSGPKHKPAHNAHQQREGWTT